MCYCQTHPTYLHHECSVLPRAEFSPQSVKRAILPLLGEFSEWRTFHQCLSWATFHLRKINARLLRSLNPLQSHQHSWKMVNPTNSPLFSYIGLLIVVPFTDCLQPLSSGQMLVIPEVLDNAISSTVPSLMLYWTMHLQLSSQLGCNLHVAKVLADLLTKCSVENYSIELNSSSAISSYVKKFRSLRTCMNKWDLSPTQYAFKCQTTLHYFFHSLFFE